MDYELIITERAELFVDKLVSYLLFKVRNQQAAAHLLDSIELLYERLEENPLQFPRPRDPYLLHKGYREAVVPDMNYTIVFKIEDEKVYVMGVFHQLEQYRKKL